VIETLERKAAECCRIGFDSPSPIYFQYFELGQQLDGTAMHYKL